MENYKLKCDLNIENVTVGNSHVSILERVSWIVTKALDEAGISYEKEDIEKYVGENCFIRFVHSDIPFTFLLK